MAGGPGWDRTSDLPRVKLKRCRKRAVIAGRTGRTGPGLRVRTTQYERHGGYRADEIAPGVGRHGCGVPSARGRHRGLSRRGWLIAETPKASSPRWRWSALGRPGNAFPLNLPHDIQRRKPSTGATVLHGQRETSWR